MDGGWRREKIKEILAKSREPVTGTELAARMAVSRQAIVQDIALLRAAGVGVLATPQGYMISQQETWARLIRTLAVQHDLERLQEELLIIVDGGGKVLDVVVEHPLYGELRGLLMLSSRRDVTQFTERLKESRAQPLSALTDGVHLHNVEAPDTYTLDYIEAALADAGILLQG